jgi:hypothetical protein
MVLSDEEMEVLEEIAEKTGSGLGELMTLLQSGTIEGFEEANRIYSRRISEEFIAR